MNTTQISTQGGGGRRRPSPALVPHIRQQRERVLGGEGAQGAGLHPFLRASFVILFNSVGFTDMRIVIMNCLLQCTFALHFKNGEDGLTADT